MISTAVSGSTAGVCLAATSPTTRSSPGTSATRTAYPSMALEAKPGRSARRHNVGGEDESETGGDRDCHQLARRRRRLTVGRTRPGALLPPRQCHASGAIGPGTH